MARKILIDTDPGIDDAMAILMALASPELDIVAMTTIFGNAAIDVATNNALSILEAAGRSDVAVARGAARPLVQDYIGPVPQVHGENGLGETAPTSPISAPVPTTAADMIYDKAAQSPGELTVVALGPLTNLGLALERYPDLPALVDEVVVMGGNALVPGNATPVGEANINNDPEAADAVFGASWRVTMVGLDVTHHVNLTGEDLERIRSATGPGAVLLARALPLYQDFYEATNGIDGIFVHDPSTIAYVLEPDLFGTDSWALRVETESFSRGKTWPNLGNTDDPVPPAWQGRPLVNVCTSVDGDAVARLVTERLTLG